MKPCNGNGPAYSESDVSSWWITAWVLSVIVTGALCFCAGAAYEYLSRAMQAAPEAEQPAAGRQVAIVAQERTAQFH